MVRSAQRIAAQQHWHAAMVDADDSAVVGLDARGAVVSWNAAAQRLLDRGAEEAIGRHWSECLEVDGAGRLAHCIDEAARGSRPSPVDVALSGGARVAVTAVPVAYGNGAVLGVALFARDVRRERLAEEALRDSEARCRAVVEDQSELICRFLVDGTLTFVNEAYCRYFDMPRESLIGRSFLELVPEEDRPAIHRFLASFGPDTGVLTYEHRVMRPDGTRAWQQWTDRALFDENGRIREYQSVGRDITARKEAEEALRRSEEQLRLITDAVPMLIARLDKGVRFTFTNRACEEWFGWPRSALHGQHLRSVVGERAYRSLHRYLEPAMAGSAAAFEASIGHRDGSVRQVSVSLVPETGEGGVRGLLVVINDINEHKRREFLERRQLIDVAHVARLSTIGELTTEIAHELNQPLTAIKAYGEALRRLVEEPTAAAGEVAGIVDEMCGQIDRSAAIVQRVRQFARKQEPQYTRFDINAVVDEALRLLHVEARWNDVAIDLRPQPHMPSVVADRILIEQVVLNLARNGLEAMRELPSGRRRLTVATGLATGGFVEVCVEDTGAGVPQEALERIFEPFFTTKPDGLGLGLAISRSIVENHGGRLSAGEARGGGAAFRFSLPCAPSAA